MSLIKKDLIFEDISKLKGVGVQLLKYLRVCEQVKNEKKITKAKIITSLKNYIGK